jgi:hypothetical protein
VGGLMYYRARYYNPRTARFISEDPIGLAGGVNLYGYVGGDPVSYADPYGLRPGDPYPTVVAAGFQAVRDINPTSQFMNHEYGGWIVPHRDGGYTYTEPITQKHPYAVVIGEKPPGAAGWYHTHGGAEGNPAHERYSPQDWNRHFERGVPGFLGTPSGKIRYYPAPPFTIPRGGARPNHRERGNPC